MATDRKSVFTIPLTVGTFLTCAVAGLGYSNRVETKLEAVARVERTVADIQERVRKIELSIARLEAKTEVKVATVKTPPYE